MIRNDTLAGQFLHMNDIIADQAVFSGIVALAIFEAPMFFSVTESPETGHWVMVRDFRN